LLTSHRDKKLNFINREFRASDKTLVQKGAYAAYRQLIIGWRKHYRDHWVHLMRINNVSSADILN
jgi:hypothetical protein